MENLSKKINVGLGKCGKHNENRALNKSRKLENMDKIPKFNKIRAFLIRP